MRVLRKISGKILLDRRTGENIRKTCNVGNVNDWVTVRRNEWNEHISIIDDTRIVRITRNKLLLGCSTSRHPHKQWSDNLKFEGQKDDEKDQAIHTNWRKKNKKTYRMTMFAPLIYLRAVVRDEIIEVSSFEHTRKKCL